MKALLIAGALIASCGAGAATPEAARTEIRHLLGAVEASQCTFNRNGSWHAPKAARAHLEKKFAYLDKKDLVPDTERFIERGASSSSASGKPYLMQCAGARPVTSAEWLTAELKRLRKK